MTLGRQFQLLKRAWASDWGVVSGTAEGNVAAACSTATPGTLTANTILPHDPPQPRPASPSPSPPRRVELAVQLAHGDGLGVEHVGVRTNLGW